MKKIVVLFNPSSGKGRSLKEKGKIEKILKVNSMEYDMFVSKSEDHLRQMTAEAIGKYETIAGVGGDTSFNIIACEILKSEKLDGTKCPAPTMGMIGTGSANDIVRGLGIEKTEDACLAIKNGKTLKMDVGYININRNPEPLFFLGTLSLGLGTTVNKFVEEFHYRHRILSKFKPFDHLLSGIYGIYDSFSKKQVPLQVRIECNDLKNIEEIEFSLLVFLNTPYYANGLRLIGDKAYPVPELFDGLLDCCIIHTKSFFNTLNIGIRAHRETHLKRSEVTMIQSPSFKISSQKEIDIQVDGEIIKGVSELKVSLLPGRLKVSC